MAPLTENKDCYRNPGQREVLQNLAECPVIGDRFFLTGGTALAVFYLHHRVSNDLDLFTRETIDLGEVDYWISRKWGGRHIKIKSGPQFLSAVIEGTKVDLAVDPLSLPLDRDRYLFENGRSICIDKLFNIASNKLCAMAGRLEPKDYLDFFFLQQSGWKFDLDEIYRAARSKDALFDDPPTAAFQIEEAVKTIKDKQLPMPKILIPFNLESFYLFFRELAEWLYKKRQM